MMHTTPQRGFTLLIAIILSSVMLALALARLDVTYKQVLLASTAKQSQYAFYAADSGLECILFYDQRYDAFGTNPNGITSVTCNGRTINFTSSGSAPKYTTFVIPCAAPALPSTEYARVQIYKGETSGEPNRLYSTGYSSCDSADARRIERGVRVLY